ncbi:hypothetical protein [Saccharothrix xinjiangensis]|uniref:Uncharacterized protein n=1 Tax=Saccharothrix xinjiangensis TaxID=204798 RepID=A0ABV9YA08_9PSEU
MDRFSLVKDFETGKKWFEVDQPVPVRQVLGHALLRGEPVDRIVDQMLDLDLQVEHVGEGIAELPTRVPVEQPGEDPPFEW